MVAFSLSAACRRGARPLAAAIVGLLFIQTAFAGQVGAAAGPPAISDDDGRRTLDQLPANVLRGARGLFTGKELRPLVYGLTVAGASALFDDDVRDAIADDDDTLAEFADDNLGPSGLGVLTAMLFIGGRQSEYPRFRAMSYDLGVAALTTLGLTGAVKAAADRERPNDSGRDSFPSGHASNAFTLASVTHAHYGNRIGLPAYALASLIGASRLRDNSHWLSDVVAGSVLGHLVGRAVVRQNSRPLGPRRDGVSLSIMPAMSSSYRAIVLAVDF